MKFQNNIFMVLTTILFTGCGDHTDQALSPPKDAHWVTVKFKMKEGLSLQPLQVMYRSDTCKDSSRNSSGESYDIKGINGFAQEFTQESQSDIWKTTVAIEGGGVCHWMLNSIKVSFKLSDANPLVSGKNNLSTNYIFDFDKFGFSEGYGAGSPKNAHGDIALSSIFFPMVVKHKDKTIDLSLFAGNTDKIKWTRRYMLQNTKLISVEPVLKLNDLVTLVPSSKPGSIDAIYPDGSKVSIDGITPDYDKLLSMK